MTVVANDLCIAAPDMSGHFHPEPNGRFKLFPFGAIGPEARFRDNGPQGAEFLRAARGADEIMYAVLGCCRRL